MSVQTQQDLYPLNFVDAADLDAAFEAVADAIRTKTGVSTGINLSIPTPTAFIDAIESIPVTIQPQLYAPTISKTGSHLDVLGNINNGTFANGAVSIYSGATKVGEASGSPPGYDLNTLSVGNHSISATASGTNCLESEKSAAISMTVYSITKNFTHLTENSVPSYTVKMVSGGTMEIRVTAATNYEFSQSSGYSVTNATVNSWVVTDSISGGTSNYGVLTISNPTGAVTITITPTLIPQLNTPAISLSSDILTIEDVPNAESYDIYDGNTLIANVPVSSTPQPPFTNVTIQGEGDFYDSSVIVDGVDITSQLEGYPSTPITITVNTSFIVTAMAGWHDEINISKDGETIWNNGALGGTYDITQYLTNGCFVYLNIDS